MQPPTTNHNHPQPSTATHNHPKPPKKQPPLPTTIHNHLQSPTTTQKLPKKSKACHKELCYCSLDVTTETDVGFDCDMKQ